jgi:predicted RND superfamily exporter protein
MRLGYTGDIAIAVEELSALVEDLALSSLIVFVLVLAVIVAFYRWWRSVPILVLPLLLATAYAFAAASLPPFDVRTLNSNTAFLASVIIGNGINCGIILLARYVEGRRKGLGVQESLDLGIWGARTGTLVASLAAALSYASLGLTQFRGFWQFGIIGGFGMMFAWGASFLLMPPLIAWLDRDERTAPKPRPVEAGMVARVLSWVGKSPRLVVGVSGAMTIGAIVLLTQLGPGRIEFDLSKLRRSDTARVGEQYWGRKMDALLGQYLTPISVMTDSPEESAAIEADLKQQIQQQPLHQLVASIVSIRDLIPSDQPERLAVAKDILRILALPSVNSAIPDKARAEVERILGKVELEQVTALDLPATLTAGLRDKTGALDLAVLVYPRPSEATWRGEPILTLTRILRQVAAAHPGPAGKIARVAGTIPLSSDIIGSIAHDGPLATGAALMAVLFLVALMFRTNQITWMVTGSLLLGVMWMTAATILFNVKINFANFIAFPITFGIGVDYSVNVMARYSQGSARDVVDAVRSTGGAVALCSLTTIIGYGSLLLAKNNALFLFGVVAVLGEIACLTTAIVVLPAVLMLIRGGTPHNQGRSPSHSEPSDIEALPAGNVAPEHGRAREWRPATS